MLLVAAQESNNDFSFGIIDRADEIFGGRRRTLINFQADVAICKLGLCRWRIWVNLGYGNPRDFPLWIFSDNNPKKPWGGRPHPMGPLGPQQEPVGFGCPASQ